jgi:hypothetical protein
MEDVVVRRLGADMAGRHLRTWQVWLLKRGLSLRPTAGAQSNTYHCVQHQTARFRSKVLVLDTGRAQGISGDGQHD